MAFMQNAYSALFVSEENPKVNQNCCVARIRIGGPLHVAHAAPRSVVPSVIRARNKAFAHFVGYEQSNATWAAMLQCGLHHGAQILVGGHMADSVVNEDRVKDSGQANRSYVALEVLTFGVEGSTHGQHLGGQIHEGHTEGSSSR